MWSWAVLMSMSGMHLRNMPVIAPGEACAIQPLEGAPPLAGAANFALQDELHSQLFLPAPRYVLVRAASRAQSLVPSRPRALAPFSRMHAGTSQS